MRKECFLLIPGKLQFMQDVPLSFFLHGEQLNGLAVPLWRYSNEKPRAFDIILNKAFLGTLRLGPQGWKMDTQQDAGLIEILGRLMQEWYGPFKELPVEYARM